jgi:hypothetical protein
MSSALNENLGASRGLGRIGGRLAGLAAGLAVLALGAVALGDELHLKDGRVLKGELVRSEAGFVYFKVEGKSTAEVFAAEDITKLVRSKPAETKPAESKPADERPAAAKPSEAKPAEIKPVDAKTGERADSKDGKKKEDISTRAITGRATRVAMLHFGPPPDWKGLVGDTVGVTISAQAFKDAIPKLEADKVDVVVVRINSGGGLLAEMQPFQDLFEYEYERKFRTVGWVQSAISCAAMSPWTLNEFYMSPEGNIGACTGWSGNLVAMKGIGLEQVIAQMERASAAGGRDSRIMRSMQIQEPLSANVDEFGNVEFFQDYTSGSIKLNPPGQILTLNAVDAVRVKFARGVAASLPELMTVMGINEWELAGQKASEFIDDGMRRMHAIYTSSGSHATRFVLAVNAASALRGEENRTERNREVGIARRALEELEKNVRVNPNFRFMLNFPTFPGVTEDSMTDEWFRQMDRQLRRIARGD